MAYRRSLTLRAKLFNQRRFSPSFSYIHHQNDRKKSDERSKVNNFLQNLTFGSSVNTLGGFSMGNSIINASGFVRHMSTTIGEGADKIDYMTDVAGVLSDNAVASQAPAVSEVAVAAADSYFPVAGLQYLIDGVHNFTGLPWWGSIAVTTLMIRGLAVPLMINQLKATSKLTLMRPKLEEIKQEMQDRGMSPTAVTEGQQRMAAIFKEYGVTPWTPLKGLLIQGPVFVSFFLAIQNMVEKVPSFKEGGAFWFVDLTTPDPFYVLPVLTAMSFLLMVECNMQEGLEGNPAGGTMKKVSRVFALLTVPLTMSFPKALFCYWITSNLFSLVYGLVIRTPGVKKFLGVPVIPVAPPTTAQQPAFSFTEALKKFVQAQQVQQAQQRLAASRTDPSKSASSLPTEPPKPASRTTKEPPAKPASSFPMAQAKPVNSRIPSSSVLSQRIRSLEKEVKGRKKGKKK